jgi:hypothetical protein
MKIRRYTFGETNLGQIARAREGVMSPGRRSPRHAYNAVAGAGDSQRWGRHQEAQN